MNHDLEREQQKAIDYLKDKMPRGIYMVTGATGKIANYIVKILLGLEGVKVIALCHSYEKGVRMFANYINCNLVIVEKDIVNPLNDIYGKVDYIIHAAGICQNRICQLFPQEVINVNVTGTYNVLEYAKRIKIKKFCFFSSAAVYGKAISNLYKEEEYGEIDFRNPQNAYALSKRVGESLCDIYQSAYSIVIVRPFHIIDPYTLFDKDLMLGEFYDKILNEQIITFNSDGTPKRNFIWIIDAVKMILEIMNQEGGTYNIGNPNGTFSVKEIADMIMKITGRQSILKYNNFEKAKPSNLLDMVPDLGKEMSVIKSMACLDVERAIRISMKAI